MLQTVKTDDDIIVTDFTCLSPPPPSPSATQLPPHDIASQLPSEDPSNQLPLIILDNSTGLVNSVKSHKLHDNDYSTSENSDSEVLFPPSSVVPSEPSSAFPSEPSSAFPSEPSSALPSEPNSAVASESECQGHFTL